MIVRAIKAYLQESWDGDLFDIVSGGLKRFSLSSRAYLDNKSLTQYGFLNKVTSCSYNCKNCNYCQDLANKLIRFGAHTRSKLEDMGLSEVADQLEYEGKLPRSS